MPNSLANYQSLITHDSPDAIYFGCSIEEFVLIDHLLRARRSRSGKPNLCDRAEKNLRLISVREGETIWCRDAHLRAALTALSPNGEDSFREAQPQAWAILTAEGRARQNGDWVGALREAKLIGDTGITLMIELDAQDYCSRDAE